MIMLYRGAIDRQLARKQRELDWFNTLYLGRLVRWDREYRRYRPLDDGDPLSRLAADVGDQIQRELAYWDALARRASATGRREAP